MIFFSNGRKSIVKSFTVHKDNKDSSIRNSMLMKGKGICFSKSLTAINTIKSSASVENNSFIHIKDRMSDFFNLIILYMRMNTATDRAGFKLFSKSNRNNDDIIIFSNI